MNLITRRGFIGYLAVAPSAMRGVALDAPAATLYIGTYTVANGATGSRGIYTSQWNAANGSLTEPVVAAVTTNPSFLAISPSLSLSRSRPRNRSLYAVDEVDNFSGTRDGSVTPFRIDGNKLTAGHPVDSGGSGPCHIAVDHSGRAIFAANYDSGSVASFLATESGLSSAVSQFKFSGHGPNLKRQEAPHTHAVTVSPGNDYLLVNDLGLDRIMIYRLQAATATLTPNSVQPYYSAKPGAGPRHSVFHPNGRWLYCVYEMDSSIDQLAWDEQHGTLKWISNAPLLPANFPLGKNTAAELAMDASGRFLYASNRGHDSIAVFSIGAWSGALTLTQRVPCGGKEPRHFAIDPSGDWLLVANEKTNDIVVFHRDRSTGMLKATGRSYKIIEPVCLVFYNPR